MGAGSDLEGVVRHGGDLHQIVSATGITAEFPAVRWHGLTDCSPGLQYGEQTVDRQEWKQGEHFGGYSHAEKKEQQLGPRW